MDVASQRESVETALDNLREALELYFEDPVATVVPRVHKIRANVKVGSNWTSAIPGCPRKLHVAEFIEVSQRGSLIKFVRRDEHGIRSIMVPRHREVVAGTLRSILRQTRLTPDEFEEL